MKRSVAIATLLLMLGGIAVILGPVAGASCAGPELEATPQQAPQGSKVRITGQYFWDACNDTVQCVIFTPTPTVTPSESPTPTPSPTTSCIKPEPAKPRQNIQLDFAQAGQRWKLAVVDSDAQARIDVVVTIPADADFGSAKIFACYRRSACTYPFEKFRVGVLAATAGRPLWPTALVGVGATLAGLAMVIFARRSSARTHTEG